MISTTDLRLPEISVCGLSDKGLKRATNEDHFLIAQFGGDAIQVHTNVPGVSSDSPGNLLPEATLLMVADGVGGATHGAFCSQLVLRRMFELMSHRLESNVEDREFLEHQLRDDVLSIRRELLADAEAHPRRYGMATTLTAVLVVWPHWYLVHVGDSRCYLIQDQSMTQLTVDHSLAETMKQRLPYEEHSTILNLRHVIWNSVSASQHHCEPDVSCGVLHDGDALLLCTDGLTLHVENHELAGVFADHPAGPSICYELANLTLERGARDNLAIVAAVFGDSSLRRH